MHHLHLYYGYGKGKTTSVMGLGVRSLGAGHKVAIVQFDKGFDGKNEHYSERKIFRELQSLGYPIVLIPTGCERMMPDGTFRFKNEPEDILEAKRGLNSAIDLINQGNIDLLILDEGLAAVAYHLLEKSDMMGIIELWESKNRPFDLVISGHKIWEDIEKHANLITEMRKVKHYFDEGAPAQLGIEF